MNTLGEVVVHTGVAGTAGQVVGAAVRVVGLRACGDLVAAVVGPVQRRSLRALCTALPTLPPIALDARVVAHGDDVTPATPEIEVSPPTGVVVETVVTFTREGVVQPFASSGRLADGQEVVGPRYSGMSFGDPGRYEAVVRRVGITGGGVVDLQRRLPFRVRPVPVPDPPAPPRPPATQGPTCQVEIDGANPGSGGTVNVRVSGGGFAAGDVLVVTQDGSFATSTAANGLGGYSVTIGVLRTVPSVRHTFRTSSTTSSASSPEAGFTA